MNAIEKKTVFLYYLHFFMEPLRSHWVSATFKFLLKAN